MSVFKTTFSRALPVFPSDNANIPYPAIAETGTLENVIPNGTTYTTGVLEVGFVYEITDYQAGDDFLNVGASANATGVTFTATASAPDDWTNGSELTLIGIYFVDSNAAFITNAVAPGDIIYINAEAITVIRAVDERTLEVNYDVTDLISNLYTVYQSSAQTTIGNAGCYLYIGNVSESPIINVTTIGGDIVSFYNVIKGTVLPVQVIKLHETGTQYTDKIIALW